VALLSKPVPQNRGSTVFMAMIRPVFGYGTPGTSSSNHMHSFMFVDSDNRNI
jgi:hypothetical protein